MRHGLKNVGRPAVDYLFADELEVEGLEQVAQERPVFLILPEPRRLLGRRFVLQLFEILVALPLFRGRRKMSVVLYELLKASPVDERHSGDVDIFRFHLPQRVQAPILITLHVDVMVARLPTALGGGDRQAHDLAGAQDASLILMFGRSVSFSEECG
jgi:hypothetical protein